MRVQLALPYLANQLLAQELPGLPGKGFVPRGAIPLALQQPKKAP